MDQPTPFRLDEYEPPTREAGAMKRVAVSFIGMAAVIAAAAGGYRLGQAGWSLPTWLPRSVVAVLEGRKSVQAPSGSGPITYYRDPDGKPFYSAEPKKTEDGRDYVPVRAGEDVSFEDKLADSGAAAGSSAASDKRILYYRNPMGLPDTSPVPKKDSMGMDYIPVYEGEADDGVTVTLSPGKLQRTGVRSEKVERRILSDPVRAPGAIEEDERRISLISVRSDSFIEKVENVTTGDHVRKGQPLFRLYSPEISAAAAQYLSAIGFEGARRRLENLGVANEVIAEIERTRRAPISITWNAPRDGVVVERNVTEGMRAPAGATLFRIVDHSAVWVLVDVPERDMAKVREGQISTVRARGFPDKVFTGPVTRIYPHLMASTRTARVRVEISNSDGMLRPAMYADVEIATGSGAAVLAAPESAVIDSGTRQIVLLDKGEGRFEPREVTIGARGDGFVEIREGIAEGDQVVVAANFLIDAESNLKAALRALSAPEPPR